jgi:hypothetical protein
MGDCKAFGLRIIAAGGGAEREDGKWLDARRMEFARAVTLSKEP